MNKNAFTLAEVLLTLAIIGVVAALTIPAVITKVTQDQYVVGLKKAFNTLKSVEREAIGINGSIENWSWAESTADFDKYLKPHFDILKDCGSDTDEGCFVGKYKQIKADTELLTDFHSNSISRIIASDGISYGYLSSPNIAGKGYIWVDLNGKKGPNRYGRDLHRFFLAHTDAMGGSAGIKPSGVSYNLDGTLRPTSVTDPQCIATGEWCTAKVLAEGAMNY